MPQEFVPDETSIKSSDHHEPVRSNAQVDNETVSEDEEKINLILGEVRTRVNQRKLRRVKSVCLAILFSIILSVLPCLLFKPLSGQTVWILILYECALVIGLGIISARHNKNPLPFDSDSLSEICGVKAIGILVDSASMNITNDQAKAIYSTLIPLFQQLNASNVHLLTAADRQAIYSNLEMELINDVEPPESIPFKLAVLKGLEQVGDKESIFVVRRLAEMKGRRPRQRVVRDAAQNCLEYLEIHINDHTEKMTLLRGSSPEAASPETLLRPATSSDVTHSDELLRPSDQA